MLSFLNSVGSSPRLPLSLSTFNINSVTKSLWLSAVDSITTIDTGKVTAISDISGNGVTVNLASTENECTYNASLSTTNNKPTWVFSDTVHDTYFQIDQSITAQDIYVVCTFGDSEDTAFDGFNALLAGNNGFGHPRIVGSSGSDDFLSSATMNFDGNVSKNFQSTPSANTLPMRIGVYRFQLSAPVTHQFYLFGSHLTPVGWRGSVSEMMILPNLADAQTADNIIQYLHNKYAIAQYSANVIFSGQSLYDYVFTLNDKEEDFVTEAKSLGFTNVTPILGAKASTAVHPDSSAANGSWTTPSEGKGAAYTNYLDTPFAATGMEPREVTHVIWMQGNSDADDIRDATITEAQFKNATNAVLDLLQADFPNAQLIITPSIGNNGLTSQGDHDGWTAVKRAQYELLIERNDITDSFGTYDLSRADAAHLDDTGATTIMQRNARLVAELNGIATPNNPLGPQISSATYNAATNSILVNITHDDGTDFTMTDPHRFEILINGSAYIPDTVVKNSSTQFTLSGGSMVINSGDTCILNWPAGTSADMSIANILLDNASNPLPLRPSFNVEVIEE